MTDVAVVEYDPRYSTVDEAAAAADADEAAAAAVVVGNDYCYSHGGDDNDDCCGLYLCHRHFYGYYFGYGDD